MTDEEWYGQCQKNWETAAAELTRAGAIRVDRIPHGIPPTLFKTTEGKWIYLARQLASSEWYVVEAGDDLCQEADRLLSGSG